MAGQDAGGKAAVTFVGGIQGFQGYGHYPVIRGEVAWVTVSGARNARISPIASARPQRLTGAFSGKAVSRRLGVAPSRITKQPRSSGPRIRRPKACFNRKRVIRSS